MILAHMANLSKFYQQRIDVRIIFLEQYSMLAHHPWRPLHHSVAVCLSSKLREEEIWTNAKTMQSETPLYIIVLRKNSYHRQNFLHKFIPAFFIWAHNGVYRFQCPKTAQWAPVRAELQLSRLCKMCNHARGYTKWSRCNVLCSTWLLVFNSHHIIYSETQTA